MKHLLYTLLFMTTSTLYGSCSDSTTLNNEHWVWSNDMDLVGGNKLLNDRRYEVSFVFMNDGRYYFYQASSGGLLTTITIFGTYIYNVDNQ